MGMNRAYTGPLMVSANVTGDMRVLACDNAGRLTVNNDYLKPMYIENIPGQDIQVDTEFPQVTTPLAEIPGIANTTYSIGIIYSRANQASPHDIHAVTHEFASATGLGLANDIPLHGSDVPKVHTHESTVTGRYTTGAGVSATGVSVSVRRFRECLLQIEFGAITGTPDDITIQLQFSDNGSTWYDYVMGPFGALVHTDSIISTGLLRCWSFRAPAENLRLKVSTSGIGNNEAFSIETARITMKN